MFVTFGVTRNPVDARLVSWDDVAADRVDVSVQVKRPAQDEVTCVLRAQDTSRIDVGYATLVIPRLEAQIASAENALSLLLGQPPGPIQRGQTLLQHVQPLAPQ